MNNQFESFVETLRCMGVKTLTIEFQQTTPITSAPWCGTPPKKTNEKEEKTYVAQPENKPVKEITSTEKAKLVKDEPPKDVHPKETTTVSNKSDYDRFWAINEEDDGGDQASEQRRTLIGVMTRDDIIRINNDCELGIDTDQPLGQLREELAACF